MCTVTWLRTPGRYDLFFNRDEKKSRLEAHPPALRELNGVRYIAPSDANAGGTWIGVNERGLTVCLLNHYGAKDSDRTHRPAVSRGKLVSGLMDARSVAEVGDRVFQAGVHLYRPFFLVAMELEGQPVLHAWDGRHLNNRALTDGDLPFSTSSFDTENVLKARKAMYDGMKAMAGEVTTELLEQYHFSRDPQGGPYSVCMHRDDAETVSFTHVTVTPNHIDLLYIPRSHHKTFRMKGDRVSLALP